MTEVYNIINNVPVIIYMTLIALLVGQSFTIMCISLIGFGWLTMARNVRNLVMMYRDREIQSCFTMLRYSDLESARKEHSSIFDQYHYSETCTVDPVDNCT